MVISELKKAIKNVRSDVLRIIIRNIIIKYAKDNNFSKVLLGDSGQSTASNIFKSVIKGRGFNIQETCSFLVKNYKGSGIDLGRPCRDFLTKEILIFLKEFKIIDQLFTNHLPQKRSNMPYNGNIDHMIDDFMDKMQHHQPTTIHTVLRTGEKIIQKGESLGSCKVCSGDIDKIANFMEVGSLNQQHPDPSSFLTNTGFLEKCQDPSSLCFGCRRIIEASNKGKMKKEKDSPPLEEIVKRIFPCENII